MPTPSWDRLRLIGNSRLVKLTIIMPFVGYLIIFNSHVVSALQLATNYFSSEVEHLLLGNINSEFLTSRLKLLYFGLFLIGVGSSLFALFCPQKVKQYADAVAFAERELAFLPVPHFYSFVDDLADEMIDRKYFDQSRYLQNQFTEFGYDWEIHPAYRWALQPGNIQEIFDKLRLDSEKSGGSFVENPSAREKPSERKPRAPRVLPSRGA